MSEEKSSLKEVTEQTTQLLQEASEKTTQSVIKHAHKYDDAYSTMQHLIDQFWQRLPYICIGIVVFLLFVVLAKLYKYFISKALSNRSHTRQNVVMVLNRVGSTFIHFFGFLVALVVIIPGFSPGQLISALGIGSVAIGFAFKDIFQNMLSGILILLGEPFRIGDTILVNGLEGTVEDIQIRATFLRSADGCRIVIPNATVYTSAVTVNTAYQQRRCEFVVGIGYEVDIERASNIVLEVLNNDMNILSDPPFTVQVVTLADFAVNLKVRWWVDTGDTTTSASLSRIQTAVKQAFDQQQIAIPYPIQEMKISPSSSSGTSIEQPRQ